MSRSRHLQISCFGNLVCLVCPHIKYFMFVTVQTTVYSMLFFCSKADYHKLIGIAAELVDSLEDTVHGEMVS